MKCYACVSGIVPVLVLFKISLLRDLMHQLGAICTLMVHAKLKHILLLTSVLAVCYISNLLRSTIRRTHTIRVVSNLPRVSIVMPCDFRVWAPFCCGWHTWPRSHTTSVVLTRQASALCSRYSIERTYVIFDCY